MSGHTGIVWDEDFLKYDFGPSHPLRPIRVKLTYDLLRTIGILENDSVKIIPAREASEDEIRSFHEDSYVKLVQHHSKTGSGYLDMGDTPAFKGCYEVSSLIVGASMVAAEQVMNETVSHSFNPAGGLHHAHPERASGFCIFNDPAVAIAYLKSKFHLKRIVYLDIDAHHGDGVMYGYYSDPGVLDIDFHESGRYLFPGTGFPDETGTGEGEGFKINIPLPPSTGDEIFLEAFDQLVPRLVRDYKPEIILVQCGADGHEQDLLAHLRLTSATYQKVIREMHTLAHELCSGRMLLYGGGGYTLANVPRVWTVAFASLADIPVENYLPTAWQKNFVENTGELSPKTLLDKPSIDSEQNKQVLQETITEIRSALK